jgi:hypothetical protein
MARSKTVLHVIKDSWRSNGGSGASLEFETAVGCSRKNGKTLWIPEDHKRFPYRGYKKTEVSDIVVPFSDKMSDRLEDFFERIIVDGIGVAQSQKKAYDCMVFAWFLASDVKLDEIQAADSLRRSELVVADANMVEPVALEPGELVVIGGKDKHNIYADHVMINLGGETGLQVFGNNGRVALSHYVDTITLYQTLYSEDLPPHTPPEPYGLHLACV